MLQKRAILVSLCLIAIPTLLRAQNVQYQQQNSNDIFTQPTQVQDIGLDPAFSNLRKTPALPNLNLPQLENYNFNRWELPSQTLSYFAPQNWLNSLQSLGSTASLGSWSFKSSPQIGLFYETETRFSFYTELGWDTNQFKLPSTHLNALEPISEDLPTSLDLGLSLSF